MAKKRKTKVPRSISSECPLCLGGRIHSRAAHERALAKIAAKKAKNPHVYDRAGKLVGKFSRRAAKIAARVVGGTVGKLKGNPKGKYQYVVETMVGVAGVFSTRKAAQDLVRRIKGSGSVPAGIKIVKRSNPKGGKVVARFRTLTQAKKAARRLANLSGRAVIIKKAARR